jgi:hypothetical protein
MHDIHNHKGRHRMTYDKMSNNKLYSLIRVKVPGMFMEGVDESNRYTAIAFLKITDGTVRPKRSRRSVRVSRFQITGER